MQKLYSFITIVLLLAIIHIKGYAQPGVGAMYIGDYSKMSSKESMDRELESGNWAYRMQTLKNVRYLFTVTMKDNSVREVRSKIYADSLANKSYLLDAENQQKIYCNQTRRITRDGNGVTGIATDSCWLFKVVSGKINAYSFLSDAAGPFSIIAYQTGTSLIQNFDPQLFELLIKDDTKAYKVFLKKDYIKSIEKYNADNQ